MLLKFFGDILPSQGCFCLVLLPEGKHLWAQSHEELATLAGRYEGRPGVYYGTAAFQSTDSRTQSNVLALKALRLDIDAGPKKFERDPDGTYPTQRDALAAVVNFSKAANLLPSKIVSSGAGLHIYYCLEDEIDPAQWKPLAEGLGRLAAAHNLRVDSSVTTDTARILRPLGALHSDDRRVTVLKDTDVFYTPEMLAARFPAPVQRVFDMSVNEDLTLGYDGPPSSAYKVAQHCGALREVATSQGDVPEPHWRAMIGLVKRCVEGLDVAQEWSQGYDGYDPAEVERKFDLWTTGPTTCAEFSRHSKACQSCQFRGKVKSPISLGMMTAPEIETLPEEKRPPEPEPPKPTGKPWDNNIPPGFEVVEKNGSLTLVALVQTEKETETGEMVPVTLHVPMTHDIFWFGRWSEADHSDDAAQVTLHLWRGTHIKSYTMEQTLVASPFKLLEFLAGKSIHTTTHKKAAQAMQDYARAMLQRIKLSGQRPKITDHMGLRILDDGTLVAVQGKFVIFPDGQIQEGTLGGVVRAVSDAMLLPIPPSFSGEWGPEAWTDHIRPKAERHAQFLREFYNRPGLEKYQLAIMLGLASPLMAFVDGPFVRGAHLPPNGLTVSLYSRKSARGKTTAIRAAIAAYGEPTALSRDANKTSSTDIARVARLTLHGTVPIGMDEMGDVNAHGMAALVQAVANGASKSRAEKNGGLIMQSGSWALIALMAANKSAREMVAVAQQESNAIQYRLLELNVEDVAEFDQATRDAHAAAWADIKTNCCGALGGVIHRALCALGADGAYNLVSQCVSKASAAIGGDQSARFQYRALGAVLALQVLLKREGLELFDAKTLLRVFKDAHDNGVEFIAQKLMPTDSLELLQRALADLQSCTVVTKTETRTSGFKAAADVMENKRMPDRVRARHISSLGITYLEANALRDWCAEHSVGELEIVREAKLRGVIKPMTSRGLYTEAYNLLKGLPDSVDARVRVIKIDTTRLNLLTSTPESTDFSDGVVVPLHPQAETVEVGDREVGS